MSKALSSRPASRDQWLDAFPIDEAQRAAKFVYEFWKELAAKAPKTFNSRKRENHITELFAMYLRKASIPQARLLGWWTFEDQSGETEIIEDELRARDRIRKDLVYMRNIKDVRVELIFEFKKLEAKPASCKVYRGRHGMRRFVDGEYAKGLPLALMVGMVIGDGDACIETLRRSLLSPEAKADLRMVRDGSGAMLREPSIVFPGVAHFDTEHNRPTAIAPPHGTMLLSHIFVELPG